MDNCCDPSRIEGGVINDSTINNPVINTPTINGTITLDMAAINSLIDQMCPMLEACVAGHINGKEFSNVTLNASTVEYSTIVGPAITGTVGLDATAATSIYNAIEPKIEELVDGKIDDITIESIGGIAATNGQGTNTTLTNPTLAGVVTITGEVVGTQAARDSLCAILNPCIAAAAEDAVDAALPGLKAELPPTSVVKSFSVDLPQEALVLRTDLNSGGTVTEQVWQVGLDELTQLFRVVVDGDTIVGDGTVDNPLKLNITEEAVPAPTLNVEIPTSIIGGRDMLLGRPDRVLKLGGWLIPVYLA